jgi:hypothetical protein
MISLSATHSTECLKSDIPTSWGTDWSSPCLSWLTVLSSWSCPDRCVLSGMQRISKAQSFPAAGMRRSVRSVSPRVDCPITFHGLAWKSDKSYFWLNNVFEMIQWLVQCLEVDTGQQGTIYWKRRTCVLAGIEGPETGIGPLHRWISHRTNWSGEQVRQRQRRTSRSSLPIGFLIG